MTTHTLDSLEREQTASDIYRVWSDWVATCSCHNPDGNGDGRADFRGDTALDAVRAWQEHVAQQLPDTVEVTGIDGWRVYVTTIQPVERDGREYSIAVMVEIPGEDTALSEFITLDDWNRLRGAR